MEFVRPSWSSDDEWKRTGVRERGRRICGEEHVLVRKREMTRWRTMFQDELSPSVSRRFFIRIHLVLINNPRAILQFQSNLSSPRREVLNTTSRYHNWKEDILLSTPCNLYEEDSSSRDEFRRLNERKTRGRRIVSTILFLLQPFHDWN